jgi:hypothetical protein
MPMQKMPSMTASPVWEAPVNASDDAGSEADGEAADALVPLVTVAVVDVVHGVDVEVVVDDVLEVDDVLVVDEVLVVEDVLEVDEVDVVGADVEVVDVAVHWTVVVGAVDEDVVEDATVDDVDDVDDEEVDEEDELDGDDELDEDAELDEEVVVFEPSGVQLNPFPPGSELLTVNCTVVDHSSVSTAVGLKHTMPAAHVALVWPVGMRAVPVGGCVPGPRVAPALISEAMEMASANVLSIWPAGVVAGDWLGRKPAALARPRPWSTMPCTAAAEPATVRVVRLGGVEPL